MSTRDFAIAPAGAFARGFPLALGGFFLLALVMTVALAVVEVLDVRVLLGAVPALLIAITTCAAMAWILRHPRVRIEDGTLVVGRLPRVRVRAGGFDLDAARVLDLDVETGLRPGFRLLGTSLPGYHAGWFRLRDGTRAFVLVTDRHRVLRLPRRDGAPLLLSVTAPDALLAALRTAA